LDFTVQTFEPKMLSLACFVAIGLVLGFLVPLSAFILLSLLALATYLAFTSGFSGSGPLYDAIFAWIALQVGYFLAVLIYVARPQLLEPAAGKTPVETHVEQQQSHDIALRDSDSPQSRQDNSERQTPSRPRR
jgi:hypothetical protein